MSTPITFPNLPQNQPYCSSTDVSNLIGQVAPILNNVATSAQIQSAINSAVKFIERETHTFFSPRRIVQRIDGNGESTINTGNKNLIAVNEVDVFFAYPLAVNRVCRDWDFVFEGTQRASGTLSFPTAAAFGPNFLPWAFSFFPEKRNVKVDAWYGPTQTVYGETLTTTDHQTYAFANPSVIQQASTTAYPTASSNPPQFMPVIYKNGQAIANTTYVLAETTVNGVTTNEWQIDQDNLVFQFVSGSNGITSIKFNSANLTTDVITADYIYWEVPDDIREACAKKAACTLLSSFATAALPDQQFQGASEIQMDGARLQYQGGQWGPTIKQWLADVDAIINHYKAPQMAWGMGNVRRWGRAW